MLQIVLNQPGEFLAQDGPEPVAAANEAMVRIHRIGVCGTDLHAFAGRQPFFEYPRILGHELGVEIVSISPNDRGLKVGDRCAVEPYLHCGECYPCRLGKTNCCETLRCLGVHCDGGMRPLLNIPVHLLHKSTKLSLDQLALVETLGIGAHAVERAVVQRGEPVLVIGAGPIGLAAVQFALAAGAEVTVLDLSESRRQFVGQLGVQTIAAPNDKLYPVVIDATGNKASMERAFESVSFAGRLAFVGIVRDRVSFDDPLLHRREMTGLASRNSAGLFPGIIRAIEEGRIDTTPWITHRMTLAAVPVDFPRVRQEASLVKAIIEV